MVYHLVGADDICLVWVLTRSELAFSLLGRLVYFPFVFVKSLLYVRLSNKHSKYSYYVVRTHTDKNIGGLKFGHLVGGLSYLMHLC